MGEQIGQIPDSLIANQYRKSLKEYNEYSLLLCMNVSSVTFTNLGFFCC